MIELRELMEDLGDVLEEHRSTITNTRQIQFIKSSGEQDKRSLAASNKLKPSPGKKPRLDRTLGTGGGFGSGGSKPGLGFGSSASDSTTGDFSSKTTGLGFSSAKKSSEPTKKKTVSFVKSSDLFSSTEVSEGKKPAHASQSRDTDTHAQSLDDMETEHSDCPWMSSLGAGAAGTGGGAGRIHKALHDHEATVEEETRSELLDKFYTLKAILPECLKKSKDHAVSALHMAADRAKLHITTNVTENKKQKGKFDCLLQIDFIDIATASALNKKTAKSNAYTQALVEFQEPYLKIVKSASGKQVLEASQAPFSDEGLVSPSAGHSGVKAKLLQSGLAGVTKLGSATSGNIHALAKAGGRGRGRGRGRGGGGGGGGLGNQRGGPVSVDWSRPLEEFLIFQHRHSNIEDPGCRATAVLRHSCDFNRMSLDYDFRHDVVLGESLVRCLVSVQGEVLAEVEGVSQASAKHLASQRALERLRQFCWTLEIKQQADSDDLGLSKDEIFGDNEKKAEAIPESNIGSKLLRAMGWKGGGVGKEGTGIAEPVKVEAVINREGLGLQAEQGMSRDFLPAVRTVILNYAKSDQQSDLVFSPEFSKDERALLHKECQKLGLKTRSTGTGDDRYLIASRRRSPEQLFSHIMQQGGETSKYRLIGPGEYHEEEEEEEDTPAEEDHDRDVHF